MFAPIDRWRENRKHRDKDPVFGEDAGFYEILAISAPDPCASSDYGKLLDVNLLELLPRIELGSSEVPPKTNAWQVYEKARDIENHRQTTHKDDSYVDFYALEELVLSGARVIVVTQGDKKRVFVESPGDTQTWTRYTSQKAKEIAQHEREKQRAKRQGWAEVYKLHQKYRAARREQFLAEEKAIAYKEQAEHIEKLLGE